MVVIRVINLISKQIFLNVGWKSLKKTVKRKRFFSVFVKMTCHHTCLKIEKQNFSQIGSWHFLLLFEPGNDLPRVTVGNQQINNNLAWRLRESDLTDLFQLDQLRLTFSSLAGSGRSDISGKGGGQERNSIVLESLPFIPYPCRLWCNDVMTASLPFPRPDSTDATGAFRNSRYCLLRAKKWRPRGFYRFRPTTTASRETTSTLTRY